MFFFVISKNPHLWESFFKRGLWEVSASAIQCIKRLGDKSFLIDQSNWTRDAKYFRTKKNLKLSTEGPAISETKQKRIKNQSSAGDGLLDPCCILRLFFARSRAVSWSFYTWTLNEPCDINLYGRSLVEIPSKCFHNCRGNVSKIEHRKSY